MHLLLVDCHSLGSVIGEHLSCRCHWKDPMSWLVGPFPLGVPCGSGLLVKLWLEEPSSHSSVLRNFRRGYLGSLPSLSSFPVTVWTVGSVLVFSRFTRRPRELQALRIPSLRDGADLR